MDISTAALKVDQKALRMDAAKAGSTADCWAGKSVDRMAAGMAVVMVGRKVAMKVESSAGELVALWAE